MKLKPQASSGENDCGISAGMPAGKGCVGDSVSPATLPSCGTGRSSIGTSGSPVARSKMKTRPILVFCSNAGTICPSLPG